MDTEDIVRRDIDRLNIANFSSPLGAEGFAAERSWESNGKAPMKSRAKSEYSYLDKVLNFFNLLKYKFKIFKLLWFIMYRLSFPRQEVYDV